MPSMQQVSSLALDNWQARGRRKVSRMFQGYDYIFKVLPCTFEDGIYHVMYGNTKVGEIRENTRYVTEVEGLLSPLGSGLSYTEEQKRQAIGFIAKSFVEVLMGDERND